MAAGIKGGRAAWILGASAWQFLQQVTALSRRARRNRLHMNVCDRAPAPNTGSARGGTRAEHPEGRESRACTAGREQSAPRPPEPQATTHIVQLNRQENGRLQASRHLRRLVESGRVLLPSSWSISPLYILCHILTLNLTNKMLIHVIKII